MTEEIMGEIKIFDGDKRRIEKCQRRNNKGN